MRYISNGTWGADQATHGDGSPVLNVTVHTPTAVIASRRRGNPDTKQTFERSISGFTSSGLPRRAAPRNDGRGCEQ